MDPTLAPPTHCNYWCWNNIVTCFHFPHPSRYLVTQRFQYERALVAIPPVYFFPFHKYPTESSTQSTCFTVQACRYFPFCMQLQPILQYIYMCSMYPQVCLPIYVSAPITTPHKRLTFPSTSHRWLRGNISGPFNGRRIRGGRAVGLLDHLNSSKNAFTYQSSILYREKDSVSNFRVFKIIIV